VKLVTDLQILGCKLHKKGLAARLCPDPLWKLQRSSDPSRYKGDRREGRKGLGIGREMKWRDGREMVGKDRKGEGVV